LAVALDEVFDVVELPLVVELVVVLVEFAVVLEGGWVEFELLFEVVFDEFPVEFEALVVLFESNS
jgi:hypothetical protein